MGPLTTRRLIVKRLLDDWKLLISIFLGFVVTTTLVAGTPIYFRSLQRVGVNAAIDRSSVFFLNFFAYAPHVQFDRDNVLKSEAYLVDAVDRYISEIYRGHERYIQSPTFLVGKPSSPLPTQPGAADQVSRGYVQYLSNMGEHVDVISGRLPTDALSQEPRGADFEAMLGSRQARVFDLEVGDELVLTPSLGDPVRVTATIVGVIDATDPSEEYWSRNSEAYLNPAPLEEEVDVEVNVDPAEPPLSLFVTLESLIAGVGEAYPGSIASMHWNLFIDKEPLKTWSIPLTKERIGQMENEFTESLPGAAVFTGITRLLDNFQRRSFFSGIPLLLLMTVMLLTVLYSIAMMVSYLVQSREDDVALLRSRGVSAVHMLRLYALEGATLAVTAAVVAPFLAMAVVSLSGALPYFRDIKETVLLPVDLHWYPFALSAAVGFVCLAMFVVPALIGSRTGLIAHKLRSSRPPSVPLFQRYYVDVGLLIIGGLVFWELRQRGQFVSGGLFEDVQVNEAMLLAPVLFLVAVALLFMRLFPMFVRFINGDAPTLLHLLAGAALAALGVGVAVDALRSDAADFAAPLALLVVAAAAYWSSHRAGGAVSRGAAMAAQAVATALFVGRDPPSPDEIAFVPTIALAALVPLHLLFLALRHFAGAAPVWVSMALLRMARNPLQYTWLVLLLVLITGLGVLATTVGGTLNRSYEERILYDVATDIRVADVPGYIARGTRSLKETYLGIPGVTQVSLGLRGQGLVGTTVSGIHFDLLAVESDDFHYMSWYRDDFSAVPLSGIMRSLQPISRQEPLVLPPDAETFGMWVKPGGEYSNMFLWAAMQDSTGIVKTLSLGEVGPPEWRLMTGEMPTGLVPPVVLAAIQTYEPVFGPSGTAGSLLMDDMHVTLGNGEEIVLVDGFEERSTWTPLATSALSTDSIAQTSQDVRSGQAAGLFVFGKDTDRGIRGFYQSPSGGPLPIVASSRFLDVTGGRVGDVMILDIMSRLVPVRFTNRVDYFPTMSSRRGGFILADLDDLLRHLNILSPTTSFFPNELFVSEAPGAGDSVSEAILRLTGTTDRVFDREARLEAVRLDPLITAGWRAMMALSLVLIVFTASLGYLIYLLAFTNRGRNEMGLLQSLGMTGRQVLGLLSIEHLAIVLVGLGMGTWAGFQMSSIMVSSVAVTEVGDPVVPPYVMVTDWPMLALIYAVTASIFLLSTLALARSMRSLELHSISRLEA